ncbi:MAG: TraR/DksA family transcriptional regulator [Pseudomonadota bacterium]
MTNEERQALKVALEKALGETADDIESLKEKTAPIAPDVSLGRLSRMEAINEKGVLEANLRSAENRLLALKRALARSDEEDFGECEECGETIPQGRLLLIPHTRYCVHCAE